MVQGLFAVHDCPRFTTCAPSVRNERQGALFAGFGKGWHCVSRKTRHQFIMRSKQTLLFSNPKHDANSALRFDVQRFQDARGFHYD